MSLLLRNASIAPGVVADLEVENGMIVGHAAHSNPATIDLEGRPTLPGIEDHHVHLMGLAASERSVDCSPEALLRSGGLAERLRGARKKSPEGWIRGTGYDLTHSGWIDRDYLDRAGVGPVRIQDRSGIYWIVDGQGLNVILPTLEHGWPPGLELDTTGRPTGRLRRLDTWLRHRWPREQPLNIQQLGNLLAARGVTAITDATPTNGTEEARMLAHAHLPQRLRMMTSEPTIAPVEGIVFDAVKVVLDDADLPEISDLRRLIARVHEEKRRVAIHCVSEIQVAFALASGLRRGDRLEHASVISADALPILARKGIILCVQPGLIYERGDRYLSETPPGDVPKIHRLASLREAGIQLLAGSDAPYGDFDPWEAIRSAIDRRTKSGVVLGQREGLSQKSALELFHGRVDSRGVRTARLAVGEPADLVILDSTWHEVTSRPDIFLTMVAGSVVFRKENRALPIE